MDPTVTNKPPEVILEFNSFRIRYQPASEYGAESLRAEVCNERELISYVLDNVIRENDVILDIGANIGLWSVPLAKKVTRGHVYSVEPDADSFNGLVENARINGVVNISSLQFAISDRVGTAPFYRRKDPELNSLFEVNPLSDDQDQSVTTVETYSIRELTRTKRIAEPQVVKIDVEGAELLVLHGMDRPTVRSVIIEIHESSLLLQGYSDPWSVVEITLRGLGFNSIDRVYPYHLLASR